MEETQIAIVGTGQMGRQLALFLVQNGYQVIIKTRRNEGRIEIMDYASKVLSKVLSADAAQETLANLSVTTDYKEISDSRLVFESVVEDYTIKMVVLREISNNVSEKSLVATNTSSLSVNRLSRALKRPERFLGVHFFNPVHKMKLVEIIRTKSTGAIELETIKVMLHKLNKDPLLVEDTPGFIVNRLLLPFINEGAMLLEQGASPEDVDKAVRLGLNHPMGPLELADLIGIDTCVSILRVLHTELNEKRYLPAPQIQRLFEEGKLGRKTGQGFYSYQKHD